MITLFSLLLTFLLAQAEGDYPDITFHKTSEFKLDEY